MFNIAILFGHFVYVWNFVWIFVMIIPVVIIVMTEKNKSNEDTYTSAV